MTAHAHRWRIETPNGPTSTGRCECGAEREYRNGEPELGKGPLHSRQVSKRAHMERQGHRAIPLPERRAG